MPISAIRQQSYTRNVEFLSQYDVNGVYRLELFDRLERSH